MNYPSICEQLQSLLFQFIHNAYTLPGGFEGDDQVLTAFAPDHLRSSKALTPSTSAIGLRVIPPVAEFERTGVCTRRVDIFPKSRILTK